MKVNVHNYEAYYLDYLEGNLSGEEVLLLEAFLNEYPHLRLQDEDILFSLADLPDPVCDTDGLKKELKLPVYTEIITSQNIEHFLIGDVDKQLPVEKQAELRRFLKNNPVFVTHKLLIDQVILKPDLTIVYADKEALKRARIIPMYWKIGSAAAVFVLVLFAINLNKSAETTSSLNAKKSPASIHSEMPEEKDGTASGHELLVQQEVSTDEVVSTGLHQKTTIVNYKRNHNYTSEGKKEQQEVQPRNLRPLYENQLALIGKRKEKSAALENLAVNELRQNIDKEPVMNEQNLHSRINENERSFDAVAMKNPVQPLTNRLSDIIKDEVDFRTTKAANEKPGGFYLKIGRLTITKKLYIYREPKKG